MRHLNRTLSSEWPYQRVVRPGPTNTRVALSPFAPTHLFLAAVPAAVPASAPASAPAAVPASVPAAVPASAPALVFPFVRALVFAFACLFVYVATPRDAVAEWSSEFACRPDFGEMEILAATNFSGQLVVGGTFDRVSGMQVREVASWDGARWREMGAGLDDIVVGFVEMDDSLIAFGTFGGIRGVPSHVARWDGNSWVGLDREPSGDVWAATEHNGRLVIAGSNPSGRNSFVEEWTGREWRPLGELPPGYPKAIRSYEGGLYVAGNFDPSVLRWDGSQWRPVGSLETPVSGLQQTADGLMAVTEYHYGRGSETPASVSRLDGDTWVRLEGSTMTPAFFVGWGVYQERLVVVERAENRGVQLLVWKDDDWLELCKSPMKSVRAMAEFQGELIACGSVAEPGAWRRSILAWDGEEWKWPPASSVAMRPKGPDGPVHFMKVDGDRLILAGAFHQVEDREAQHVAAMSPQGWTTFENPRRGVRVDDPSDPEAVAAARKALESMGVDSTLCNSQASVASVGVHDGEIYAGARIVGGSGTSRRHYLASKWTGHKWECVGSPAEPMKWGSVGSTTLATWNGTLVAGGSFESIGGLSFAGVATLTDGDWVPLGNTGSLRSRAQGFSSPTINVLSVHDNRLYCGGSFYTEWEELGGVAIWNGEGWDALDGGVDGEVNLLMPIPKGGRTAGRQPQELLVAGRFDRAGLLYTRNVAVWDGEAWSALGKGLDGEVTAATYHDRQIVVAIQIAEADGVRRHVLKGWDGNSWKPFPTTDSFDGEIRALASFNGDLWVGGNFGHVGDQPSPFVARWIRP